MLPEKENSIKKLSSQQVDPGDRCLEIILMISIMANEFNNFFLASKRSRTVTETMAELQAVIYGKVLGNVCVNKEI